MWCTRWFLPLLFLPIPTASPYFLVLFILSLTMHAKPCFYCIILLTTLFISSCYWQPFTLDTPLAIPWSENITTFGAALNATLSKDLLNITLPSTIRVIDRCWCDFSTNGFFEPYNVTQWEWNSVDKLKTDLEKQAAATLMLEFAEKDQDGELASPAASLTSSHVGMPHLLSFGRPFGFFYGPWYQSRNPSEASAATFPPEIFSTEPPKSLPLLRKEYDLRPYGLNITIDFGWSRAVP
ncbi:hypothetical protein BDN71DRAFT_1481460 [Pleurotus eryngii]|uniref:Uncharacterized protein n=1 Tax=Pleurotus eryngii TaxID=5323 RepID=A0A9P6A1J1_PLEER|nr:hypothetical protein BDN71DRAFT_1481460 [Pleurotus eryngii]